MQKDYYEILGVRSTAHSSEIKRAYRKLALLYHPDRNPDPTAELYIKEINEAYDVLSDPEKRNTYDLRQQIPLIEAQPYEPPRHRDPAYHRDPNTPRPHWKSERQKMQEMMAEYYREARWSIFVAMFFSLLFFVDFVLPSRHAVDKITRITNSKEVTSRRSGNAQDFTTMIYFENLSRVKIGSSDGDHFLEGEIATLKRSFIFKVPDVLIAQNGYTATIPITIYNSFAFAPITLFLTALAGIYFTKRIEMTFNIGVACFFILILNLVFVSIS